MYCHNCGKQIDKNDVFCTHCGTRVKIVETTNQNSHSSDAVDKMQECVYCPYCMSDNLMYGKEGFSGGQALAGAILVGGIGLLAGTIGSKDVRITCLKCGKGFGLDKAFVTTPESKDLYEERLRNVIYQKGTTAAMDIVHKKFPKAGIGDCREMVDCYRKQHNISLSVQAKHEEKKTVVQRIIIIAIIVLVLWLIIQFV